MLNKTCPVCGKNFEAKRKTDKYCSKLCSDKQHRDNMRKRGRRIKEAREKSEPIIRVCKICGESFEIKSNSQVYCSKKCNRIAHAERNKTAWFESTKVDLSQYGENMRKKNKKAKELGLTFVELQKKESIEKYARVKR